jgi:hypothetical protein
MDRPQPLKRLDVLLDEAARTPPGRLPVGIGGADGIRTHDLLDAIEARFQLRHGPTAFGYVDFYTPPPATRQTRYIPLPIAPRRGKIQAQPRKHPRVRWCLI